MTPRLSVRAFVLLSLFCFGVFVAVAQESLSFEEAVNLSQQSPAVELARVQVSSAQKQLAIASSPVSGTLTGGYSSSAGALTAPTLSEPERLDSSSFDPLRLSANFNLIPYGPRFDSVLQARARLRQAELDLRDAQASSLISTVEAYFTALRATQELELKQLALSTAQSELEANQSRFDAGAISASQLTQSQLALQQAQLDLASAQLASTGDLLTLSNLLGVPVEAVADTAITLELKEDYDLETQVLARSDVQKAFLSLEQTRRDAAATLRDNLPSGTVGLTYNHATDNQNLGLGASFSTSNFQPSLSASYDFDYSPPGATPEDSSSDSFGFSIGLSIPLDASLPDALALADISVNQAQLNYEQTLDTARLRIHNAEQQVRSLEESLALSQELLEQARVTLETTQKRFELGLVSQFDVLGAQQNLAEQELRFGQAQDSLVLALLAYLQSLGLNPMEVF
ncbi:MAG: TolC family protein [Trueperaceae bacterium]|nr:TolC family protein [Trueperaceae bacterium]